MRRVFGGLAFFLTGQVALAQAQSNPSTPEQVVRDFFKAEEEGRWLDAALSLDLTRFEPIRRSVVQAVASIASRPKTTAQEVMRFQPDVPLAVAEYEAKRSNETVQGLDFLSREFARVTSVDSLASMPADQAAARWLEARGSKYQNELAFQESKRRPEANCPEVPDSVVRSMRAELKPPMATILGATQASDSVRYVVVGFTRFGGYAPKPDDAPNPEMSPRAITLRKLDGIWRILPAMDMTHSDALGGSSSVAIRCSMDKPSKSGARKK